MTDHDRTAAPDHQEREAVGLCREQKQDQEGFPRGLGEYFALIRLICQAQAESTSVRFPSRPGSQVATNLLDHADAVVAIVRDVDRARGVDGDTVWRVELGSTAGPVGKAGRARTSQRGDDTRWGDFADTLVV